MSSDQDLPFARVGFGTAEIANLQRRLSESEAQDVLRAAWDGGIRMFDTAPGYGCGLGELRLGTFLRDCDRASYTLSTKIGRAFTAKAPTHPSIFAAPLPFAARFGYDYDDVMRAFEQSVLRLGIARIDTLFVHDLDRRNHGDGVDAHLRALTFGGLRAMVELKRAGDVGAIGIAVNETDIGTRMLAEGDWDTALLASRYTLLEQDALDEFLPAAMRRGVAVLAGGIFNSGILAGGAASGATYDYVAPPDAIRDRVAALEAVCARHGVKLAAASLQLVLAHPAITHVLLGTSRRERVAETAALLADTIPDLFWRELRDRGLVRPDAPLPASHTPAA